MDSLATLDELIAARRAGADLDTDYGDVVYWHARFVELLERFVPVDPVRPEPDPREARQCPLCGFGLVWALPAGAPDGTATLARCGRGRYGTPPHLDVWCPWSGQVVRAGSSVVFRDDPGRFIPDSYAVARWSGRDRHTRRGWRDTGTGLVDFPVVLAGIAQIGGRRWPWKLDAGYVPVVVEDGRITPFLEAIALKKIGADI